MREDSSFYRWRASSNTIQHNVLAQYYEVKTINPIKTMGKYNKSSNKSLKTLQEPNDPKEWSKYNNKCHKCGLEGENKLGALLNKGEISPWEGEWLSQHCPNTPKDPPTNSLKWWKGPIME